MSRDARSIVSRASIIALRSFSVEDGSVARARRSGMASTASGPNFPNASAAPTRADAVLGTQHADQRGDGALSRLGIRGNLAERHDHRIGAGHLLFRVEQRVERVDQGRYSDGSPRPDGPRPSPAAKRRSGMPRCLGVARLRRSINAAMTSSFERSGPARSPPGRLGPTP